MIEEQKNNPLHGVKLEALLTELVDHYGWDVLANAINVNCFKSNPSIKSSLKFLRKTPWAREKVEGFYLYKYKRLPKPDDEQYELPPRDRKVPLHQKPRDPAVIEVDKSERPKRSKSEKTASSTKPAKTSSERGTLSRRETSFDGKASSESSPQLADDPWAKWKSKNQE